MSSTQLNIQPAESGEYVSANGEVKNIATLLGQLGAVPVQYDPEKARDILNRTTPKSGLIIGRDGTVYDLVNLMLPIQTSLQPDDVIDSTNSTETQKPLSANMGRVLQLEVNVLKSLGKFLSLWDAATGLPVTNPDENPYTYKTGDFYIVSNVGETNYRPTGTTYDRTPSTTEETVALKVLDFYVFDGSVWALLHHGDIAVTFGMISGEVSDNAKLVAALAAKQGLLSEEQLAATNSGITETKVSNYDGYAAQIAGKQGTLTAGANISIDSNNVISSTGGGASSLTDIAVAGNNVTFEAGPYKDFNIIGSLTFNNGVVSGFNSSNYIETKEALPSSITSFEMTMKFKTPSTISTSLEYPFLSKKGALTYIGIQGSNSKLIHSVGSLTGTTTLTANTEYTLKIKLENDLYRYYLDDVLQFSYSSLIFAGYVMEVGISKNYATGIGNGSIDLNNTSITINGSNWWTPLQDIGTKKIINSTGLVNTATGSGSLTIQGNASAANSSINIGEGSRGYLSGVALGNSSGVYNNAGTAVGSTTRVQRNFGIAVGSRATVSSGGSGYNGIALGYYATAGAAGAIMLGCGTNSEAKTFKVALNDTATAATTEETGLYTLLQSDGTIPSARLKNTIEVVETMPETPVEGKIYFVLGS